MVLAAIAETALGEDGHGAIQFRQDLIKAMLSASDKYVLRWECKILLTCR